MSALLSRLVRFAVRRVVQDPRARATVANAARGVAEEARVIAAEKDRARAAGRSVRRAMNKLQSGRHEP